MNSASLLVLTLILAVAMGSSVAEKDDANEILILTNETFRAVVAANKYVVIEFCRHFL